jgi:hypothetical protein
MFAIGYGFDDTLLMGSISLYLFLFQIIASVRNILQKKPGGEVCQ